MADTSQCLAAETVRRHGRKIIKATNLTRRETFADDLHVFTLAKPNNILETLLRFNSRFLGKAGLCIAPRVFSL